MYSTNHPKDIYRGMLKDPPLKISQGKNIRGYVAKSA